MADITITLTEDEAKSVEWAVLNVTNWPGEDGITIATANRARKKIEDATKTARKESK